MGFELTESEYAGGGFNDPFGFEADLAKDESAQATEDSSPEETQQTTTPEETPAEDKENFSGDDTGSPSEKQGEVNESTPSPSGKPSDPEGAGKQPPTAPAPSGDDELQRTLTAQAELIKNLQGQMSAMRGATVPKQTQQTPTEIPDFATEEEWIENPELAAKKNARATHHQVMAEMQQREQQQHEQQITRIASQQRDVAQRIVSTDPRFSQGGEFFDLWGSIYENPQNGLMDRPDGPAIAAGRVINLMQPQAATQETQANRTASPRQVMHRSQKGGRKANISPITNEHKKWQKRFGVSDASMNEVLKGGQ